MMRQAHEDRVDEPPTGNRPSERVEVHFSVAGGLRERVLAAVQRAVGRKLLREFFSRVLGSMTEDEMVARFNDNEKPFPDDEPRSVVRFKLDAGLHSTVLSAIERAAGGKRCWGVFFDRVLGSLSEDEMVERFVQAAR